MNDSSGSIRGFLVWNDEMGRKRRGGRKRQNEIKKGEERQRNIYLAFRGGGIFPAGDRAGNYKRLHTREIMALGMNVRYVRDEIQRK